MPKLIVNILEQIDIEQAQRNGRMLHAGAAQQILQSRPEMVTVRKARERIVIRLPGEPLAGGVVRGDILRYAHHLPDSAIGIPGKRRFPGRKPDPVAIGVTRPVFDTLYVAASGAAQGLMMKAQRGKIVGMKQFHHHVIEIAAFVRLVSQNSGDLAVLKDILSLHQIEHVKQAGRSGCHAFEKAMPAGQVRLRALAFGNIASNRLEPGQLVALGQELYVLPDPALAPVPVDDGEFVVAGLAAARHLPHVEVPHLAAHIEPDQLRERPSDHFHFTVMQQLQGRLIAIGEAPLFIQAEDHIGGQFHGLSIVLMTQGARFAENLPAPQIERKLPARDDDQDAADEA